WFFFFFSSRRRHTRSDRDWSSDVCSSDLVHGGQHALRDENREEPGVLLCRALDRLPEDGNRNRHRSFVGGGLDGLRPARDAEPRDRKSTRLNSSHDQISYAVFCLKKKIINRITKQLPP